SFSPPGRYRRGRAYQTSVPGRRILWPRPRLYFVAALDSGCSSGVPRFTRFGPVVPDALVQGIEDDRVLRDHSSRRGARRRCCRWRDRERDPRVPAVGTVLCGKFTVVLQIEIALQVADRKDEAELRADADHLRLEAADPIAGATVATDLLVDVAHRSDLKLLGQ